MKKRSDIPQKYKWDIEAMYSDESIWDKDFAEVKIMASEFSKLSGKLVGNPKKISEAFVKKDKISRLLEKVFAYSHMKKDEDNTISKYQAMNEKAHSLASQASAMMAFFIPEIIATDEKELIKALDIIPGFALYRHVLEEIFKEKKHILSTPEETILAQLSEVVGAPDSIFRMINNADIKFGEITDEDGKKAEVTHGTYTSFLESENRQVRKDAFFAMYDAFGKQKNTIANTYYYSVKSDVVTSRIRKYDSPLHEALSSDNIDKKVYENLIKTVNSGLDSMHRYVKIRKKMLKIDDLCMYDMYVPLMNVPNKKVKYEAGLELVKKGLKPLGEEYIKIMQDGFYKRWIDVYENENKTSGAYSFGTYDSYPYILLNYDNKLKDVFTIAHEMGHSMHSYYSRKAQEYVYAGHSIFTAEVASTVNEALLMDYLLKNSKDKNEKIYLINMFIEAFRGTFFRQTMFAEFEKLTHEAVSDGEVLTQEFLCEIYDGLVKKYFGKEVTYDKEISLEWARIPHFYRAFYVYKYATGYSAAIALSERILNGGDKELNEYLHFLKSGESDYPAELLKGAGVDMNKPEPIKYALSKFSELVTEMEKLV